MKTKLHPICTLALMLTWSMSFAQLPTESKLYQNYPLGFKMLEAGYNLQNMNSTIDTNIPLGDKDVKVNANIGYVRYAHFFNFLGKSAGFQAIVPAVNINADILGRSANNTGMGDVILVIGTNIFGGDAMPLAQFMKTPKKTILAWSFAVVAPTGAYSSDRLINPSGHRWQFKPELAFTLPINKFDFELYASARFFTDNTEYPSLIASRPPITLNQKPLYDLTFHTVYNFNSKFYITGTIYERIGGETTKDGVFQDNTQTLLVLGGAANYNLNKNFQLGASYYNNISGQNVSDGYTAAAKLVYMFNLK